MCETKECQAVHRLIDGIKGEGQSVGQMPTCTAVFDTVTALSEATGLLVERFDVDLHVGAIEVGEPRSATFETTGFSIRTVGGDLIEYELPYESPRATNPRTLCGYWIHGDAVTYYGNDCPTETFVACLTAGKGPKLSISSNEWMEEVIADHLGMQIGGTKP